LLNIIYINYIKFLKGGGMRIYRLEIAINSDDECEYIKESIVNDNDTTIGEVDMSDYWDATTSLIDMSDEIGEA
tara:strand:- start:206 stop:427 length:222 start_codon:yes stop_codon:yes gene_type:complete